MEQEKRGVYYTAVAVQDENLLPIAAAIATDKQASDDAKNAATLLVRDDDDPDAGAVFEYDTETLEINEFNDKVFEPIFVVLCLMGLAAFLWLLLGGAPLWSLRLFVCFVALVSIVGFRTCCSASDQRARSSHTFKPPPHTAVKRQGLWHVQPSWSPTHEMGGTLLIPFAEIRDITVSRHQVPTRLPISVVRIVTRSSDGTEYIKNGFPSLVADGASVRLDLFGLVDPFQLKRLVLSMRDETCNETLCRAKEALEESGTISELQELRTELAKQIEMIESSKKRSEA